MTSAMDELKKYTTYWDALEIYHCIGFVDRLDKIYGYEDRDAILLAEKGIFNLIRDGRKTENRITIKQAGKVIADEVFP